MTFLVMIAITVCGLFSTRPAFALSPYHGWVVTEVVIEGVPVELAKQLKSGLALNLRSGLLKGRRPRFSESDLENDLQRITLFLARHGYPQAVADEQIEPNERRKQVKVIVKVDPGAAFRFGKAKVIGIPEQLAEAASQATTPILPGKPFADEVVTTIQAKFDSLVQANGYARSETKTILTFTESNSVDLEFQVEAGDPFRIESITITGIPDNLEAVTRKTINIEPGTPYSPAVIEQARDNLRTLGLFRQIRLKWQETGPETLELNADLQTASPRTIDLSVGSWTNDPWRLGAVWMHRNLFKKGRGLSIEGSYSLYRRLLRAATWWLALLGPRTRVEFFIRQEIQDEEAFNVDEQAVGLAALHDFGRNSSLSYGVTVANSDVTEKIPEQESFLAESGLQTIFSARWFWDRSNHLLIPTQGGRTTLAFALSPPGALSESPYASVEVEEVLYTPVAEKNVWANRLNLAIAWPLKKDQELFPNRRLYAGGVNSQRGYQRRMLGPLNANMEPTGGEVRVLANSELRFPLPGIFGGNVFLDVGQVWEKQNQVDLSELAVAIGTGVAIVTPVGPIRFDLAYNLTKPPEDSPYTVFHVSIGNPF